MKKDIFDKTVEQLKEIVCSWGKCDVYLVGGCVRDLLLGNPPKDIDICINEENGADNFVDYLKSGFSHLCHGFAKYPKYGTSKFIIKVDSDNEVEIECVMPRAETYNTGPRKPDSVYFTSLKEDASRRDFCCNALYKNVVTGEILDPTERGIEDLNNRILRTPLDPEQTFIDDPLRMLRAFRFAAQKNFAIDENVLEKIKPYDEYYKLSMERVRDEFSKILMSQDPISYIRKIHEVGLLEYIIPELEQSWGFDQNSIYHSMNLTEHMFSALKFIIDNKPDSSLNLRMAALLHDISKYRYHQVKSDGHFSFHDHERLSGEMAYSIMNRLKFKKEDCEIVSTLIKNHMKLKPFYDKITGDYNGKPKHTRRLVREFGDLMEESLWLIDGDNNSHSPIYCMPTQIPTFKAKLDEDVYKINYQDRICIEKFINGSDIIRYFDLPGPGKLVGEIKQIMQEMYEDNPSLTKEDLFSEFSKRYKKDWKFWIYENHASISKPEKTESGWVLSDKNEIPLDLDENEYVDSIIQVDSLSHPLLYRRLINHSFSLELTKEIKETMKKFLSLYNFDGMGMDITANGDITGIVRWKSHKSQKI